MHKILFVPSKSLFPQSYVNSGGSLVGLMVTFFKRAYATPRSAALNMPANLENSAVTTGPEKVSFHSNPKKRQCPFWGRFKGAKYRFALQDGLGASLETL